MATGHGRTTRALSHIAPSVIITILLIFASSIQSYAQTKVGEPAKPVAHFLSSPRAMAMGGCAANLPFYQSCLQNPATLGVYHLNRAFSASLSRSGDRYPYPFDDFKLKSATVSVGASLSPQTNDRLKASVAVAYAKPTVEVEYYTTIYEHYLDPNRKSTWTYSDETIAVGGCVEYIVRLGLGRRFAEQSDAAGILVELPLAMDLTWLNRSIESGNPPNRLEITPSLAYVRLDDRRAETYGFSLYGGVIQDINELGSFRFSYEIENLHPDEIGKIGGEIGVLGMLFLRAGSYNAFEEHPAHTTLGVGFSLHGLLTWLNRWGVINPSNDQLEKLVKHLDITVDYSWYDRNSDSFDNTNFFGVGISL